MRNVALDLGRRISYCEVRSGEVVARQTVSDLDGLERLLGKTTGPAMVAVEACREAWAAARWLEERGHAAVLVDTTRVRALGIGQHNRKTDRIDAETLARAVERDLIPKAHLLSENQQEVRMQLGVRRTLVNARTSYAVGIRHLLRARGCRAARCKPDKLAVRVEAMQLPEQDRQLISPLVAMLKAVEPQLMQADARLAALASREPITKKLQTAPGVGTVIAAAFVSVLDSPTRFKKAHQVESYLGLVPSEFTSGARRLGSITKRGNSYLRALLVQGAWTILRSRNEKYEPLVAWAKQVAARRGKRVAVLAIARRLAGILWAMWRDDAEYDAQRAGLESAEGARAAASRQATLAEAYEGAAERARDLTHLKKSLQEVQPTR